MPREQKNDDLVNNLVRLLKNLRFSSIWVKSHSTYPEPFLSAMEDIEYQPPLITRKNETTYYFEFVDGDLSQLEYLKNPLQKMIDLGDRKWDTDFVLVTQYGNKETVRKWCQNCNLPVDQIWEL